MRQPRIAVILDENTSGGGSRYEAAKGYFDGVSRAGGLPFGIPYLSDMVEVVAQDFDGLLCVGGRFAYPDAWYRAGERSAAPASERLDIERALLEAFLAADRPVLGICAGMQMLACLAGCRLTPNLRQAMPDALDHDGREASHRIDIVPGSRLAAIVGRFAMEVNSYHREAVVDLSPSIVVGARAPDGIVEAIELPGHRFAVGLQWHQELLIGRDHPGDRIFEAFVESARA